MKVTLTILLLLVASLRAGQSGEDRIREAQAAYHVIEAVLAAPDMTFKMPVLHAAFRDTPEWEQRLQHIIARETWTFAKVHFIHFYWKKVSRKNAAFMDRMFDFVQAYQRTDDTLAIVDEMLEAKKRPNKAPEPTPPSVMPRASERVSK